MVKHFRTPHHSIINRLFSIWIACLLFFVTPVHTLPLNEDLLVATQQYLFQWSDHLTSTTDYAGSFWRFTGDKRHFQGNIQPANLSQLLVMKWHAQGPHTQGLICIGHQLEDSPDVSQRFHDDAVTFTRLHHQNHVDVFRVNFHGTSGTSEIIITDGQLIPECTVRFHDPQNQDVHLTLMVDLYEYLSAVSVKAAKQNDTSSPFSGMGTKPSMPILAGSSSPTTFQDPKPPPGGGKMFLDFVVTILPSVFTGQGASPFNQEGQIGECKNKICILVRQGGHRWVINISDDDWELLRQHGALSSPSMLLLMTQQLWRSRTILSHLQDDLLSLLEQTSCPDLSLWQESMDIPPDQIFVSHWLEGFYRQQILELAGLEVKSNEASDQTQLLAQLRNMVNELILQQRLENALAEISHTPSSSLSSDTATTKFPQSPEALQKLLDERTRELWQSLLAQEISNVIAPSPTIVQLPTSSAVTKPQPTNAPRSVTSQASQPRPEATGNNQFQKQFQKQKRGGRPPLDELMARQSLYDQHDLLSQWLHEPIQMAINQNSPTTISELFTALGQNSLILKDFSQILPIMEPGQSTEKLMIEGVESALKKGFFSKGIILTLYWIRFGKRALDQQPFIGNNEGSYEIITALKNNGFKELRSLVRYSLPALFLDFLEIMTSPFSNTYQAMTAENIDLSLIYQKFETDHLNSRTSDYRRQDIPFSSIASLPSLPPEERLTPPQTLEDLPVGQGESVRDQSIMTINRSDPDFLARARRFFEFWRSTPGSIAKIDGEDLHLFSSLPIKSDTPSQIIHWIEERSQKSWDWWERNLGLSDVFQSIPFSEQAEKVKDFTDQLHYSFNESQWLKLFTQALWEILPEGIRTIEAVSVKLGVANRRWEYNQEKNTFELRSEPHIVVFQVQKNRSDELTSIWYSLENIHLLSGVMMGLLKDWRAVGKALLPGLNSLLQQAQEMCGSWIISHRKIEQASFYDAGNPLLIQLPRYHKLLAAEKVKPLIMALYEPAGIGQEKLIKQFKLTAIEPQKLQELITREQASPPQNIPDAHADPVGDKLAGSFVNYWNVRERLDASNPAISYLDQKGKTQIKVSELYATLHFFGHPEFDYRRLAQNNFQGSIINAYLQRQHSDIMSQYFQYAREVDDLLKTLDQYSLRLEDFMSRLSPRTAEELQQTSSPQELLHNFRLYNRRMYDDLINRLELDYRYYQQDASGATVSRDCPQCAAHPDEGATRLQPISYSQLAPAYCDKEKRQLSCGACDQCGATLFMIDYQRSRAYVDNPVIAHCSKHGVDICQNCLKGVNCPVCKESMELIPALNSEYAKSFPEGYDVSCDECRGFISSVDRQGEVTRGRGLINRCAGQDKHDICHSCVIAQRHNLPAHTDPSRQYAFHYWPQFSCTQCSECLPANAPVVHTTGENGKYTGFYHTQCINQTASPEQ